MFALLYAERVRLARFGLSGLCSTALHVLIASALYALFDATQVIANAVAFVGATAFSYLANTLWSFSSTVHSRNLVRYLTVALAGFAETMALARAAELLDVPRGWAIVAIALLIPPTMFVLHRVWTYR
ncbi:MULTISPECIES: GtrA family protein [unclassified Burkholderia]|uniref:GtrA family protein n=1 Tax=unclassified Burkholderia TaxID=2613784 RepID=UPI000F561B00|nr:MULTISPECIES: GtrA family protein [unclassified Burkholderia]MCR4469473.1 GtrA family protein [Burkholderia sp. SCN-KJ]RQR46265.1 GtrA family protein [Burkholderia sp. Bp9131]RQR78875.1 GtrA family protein [Burkholderia sp. Bp9015]RQS40450.1 GtrA family protein [Burkholderia sp. Bp8990]RQZ30435.1 GtrA family protein [Burkholderia sp. Bp9090]